MATFIGVTAQPSSFSTAGGGIQGVTAQPHTYSFTYIGSVVIPKVSSAFWY